MRRILSSILMCLLLTSCVSLSDYENVEYQRLKDELVAYDLPEIHKKSPGLAGTLNVLPGFGNIYLGQGEKFLSNLLYWPFSIVWGVPQAVVDSHKVNQKETLHYYRFGLGKEKLIKARKL